MRRTSLNARLRARLHGDERGFTIIETVIAITVIFASLTAMAYTATAGFTTIAYGRERIQATGLANKIMEEIRGQAYTKITQGIKTTELTTDPRIVYCTADASYHFESCTSANGSGEKIVSTAGLANTPWLVPHKSATPITVGTLTANWAVYVTNDDPVSSAYRVTVIVDWTSRAHPDAANNTVRIQSLFWSPSGCVSSETHPFAAPCQPFFYGQASVPQGQIKIAGQIHNNGVAWDQSVMKFTGAEADLQQEQVSELQSTFTQSGVTTTDNGVTTSAGGTVTTASAADSDPAGAASTYQSSAATGAADSLSVHQSDSYTATTNEIGLTVSTPTGDSGTAQTAVQANATTRVCPPPTDTAETDNLACSGARIQMGGTATSAATATSLFSHALGSTGLGSATIVNVGAATSNPNKALVDREAVAGQDGRVEMTSTRRMGTINIGGMPSGMTAPTGWTGASPYGNYCVTLAAYQDTTTAQAGTTTVAPAATVNSGTIYYYNGTGFSNKTATDATLPAQTVTCTKTQTINSKVVVWTASVNANGFTPAATATSSTAGSVATTRTDVESSVTPPSIVVHYTVTIAGVTEMDYTITLDLGVNRSRGVYAPAPPSG